MLLENELRAPDLTDEFELVSCVQNHVHDRLGRLRSDFDVSVHEGSRHAAQSALILSFSNIDMLAALSGGNAAGTAPSNQLVIDYMMRYMRYTREQSSFLQKHFRHRLVHLAWPKVIMKHEDAFVLSEIYFESNAKHLTLVRSQEGMRTRYGPMLGPQWSSRFTHAFSISVDQFVTDIIDSAIGCGGYLQALEDCGELRDNARKALSEIYLP